MGEFPLDRPGDIPVRLLIFRSRAPASSRRCRDAHPRCDSFSDSVWRDRSRRGGYIAPHVRARHARRADRRNAAGADCSRAWSCSRRDGRIWTLATEDAKRLKPLPASFQSYPSAVLRNRLQDELGRSFQVVGTGHYLVALPVGVRTNWAERFEELYRSFTLYFSVRGFPLQEPAFPLTAIVWPNEESYLLRRPRRGHEHRRRGRRPLLADQQSHHALRHERWPRGTAELRETSATLIHEATHQTAFNTGVHQRFGQSPRWLVEGLGMMFEAPGVWNSRAYQRREDRINRDSARLLSEATGANA